LFLVDFIATILQEPIKKKVQRINKPESSLKNSAWKENNHSYKLYHHLLREIATNYITHDRLTSPNSENGDKWRHTVIPTQLYCTMDVIT